MATESNGLRVELQDVSKRFGRQWIVKQLTTTYLSGHTYGISGRNGSGKSTLLRMVAGQLTPSRGRVRHLIDNRPINISEVYQQVSWIGPYSELIEELTVSEMLTFHFRMKPALASLTVGDILGRIELASAADRKLSECSSGMRQRVLLATALYSSAPLLLLDEPTITLDGAAVTWFEAELDRYRGDKCCIIASNDARDLRSCTHTLDL